MDNKSNDRHKDHSRQYNVRIPTPLLDAFNETCKLRGLLPAAVVRTLMQGFVDISASDAERGAT
jgi:hypothetical protein